MESTVSTTGPDAGGVIFFGVATSSRLSLSGERGRGFGGVEGLEDGGDGGSGVGGGCQVCTLEVFLDEPPRGTRGLEDVGVADLVVADLVDWVSLDLDEVGPAAGGFAGDVNERPASMRLIRFLVKFTGATRPEPSNEEGPSPPSAESPYVSLIAAGGALRGWSRTSALLDEVAGERCTPAGTDERRPGRASPP